MLFVKPVGSLSNLHYEIDSYIWSPWQIPPGWEPHGLPLKMTKLSSGTLTRLEAHLTVKLVLSATQFLRPIKWHSWMTFPRALDWMEIYPGRQGCDKVIKHRILLIGEMVTYNCEYCGWYQKGIKKLVSLEPLSFQLSVLLQAVCVFHAFIVLKINIRD